MKFSLTTLLTWVTFACVTIGWGEVRYWQGAKSAFALTEEQDRLRQDRYEYAADVLRAEEAIRAYSK